LDKDHYSPYVPGLIQLEGKGAVSQDFLREFSTMNINNAVNKKENTVIFNMSFLLFGLAVVLGIKAFVFENL